MIWRIRTKIHHFKIWLDALRGLTIRGQGRKSRLPVVGEELLACCPNEQWKTVAEVDIWGDSIEYTDGTSDSIRHCGWLTYEDYLTTVTQE